METPKLCSPAQAESFARKAAGIPEIRDIICELVNVCGEGMLGSGKTPEATVCTTLACLLRTSHAFFFSASRVLWGAREIEAEDLLTLLPGVVKKRWRNSTTVSVLVTTPKPDLLPNAGLDRFNLYAPHVKRLRSNLVLYLHKNPQDLSTIRAFAQASTLLPNLVSLSTKGPTCSTGDDSANALLDWLEILMPASLQKLDLSHSQNRHSFSATVVDRFYRFIETSVINCPNLSSLSFSYGGAPATHYPGFFAAHTLLPTNVIRLRCRFAVFCPELLAWLAGMSKLRRLEFDGLDGFHSAFNDISLSEQYSAFAKLEHLILTHCWVGPTMQLCQSPLAKNLTRLDINCTTGEGWYSTSIVRLVQELAECCSNLVELTLDCSPNQFPPNVLPFLQRLALRKLSIPRATRKLIGGPRAVRDLLHLWPSLRVLDLRSYDASFEDLMHIVPFSPQLSILRLGIEMNIPYGISNADSVQVPQPTSRYQPLTLVSSYDHPRRTYETPELDELARYLSSLRPCTNFWTCGDRQDPWVFRRYEWLKYLNIRLDMHSQAYLKSQNERDELE